MIGDQDAGILSPAWAGIDVSALSDHAWIDAALRVECALARCQARLGVIPRDAATTIEEVAARLRLDPHELATSVRDTSNFAIGLVQRLQRAVDETAPGTGDYVHLGATSQDVLDSATMLVVTEALLRVEVLLDSVRSHLVRLMSEHGHHPMAGRTVSQHAVPITFGVKVANWLNGVIDAERHLRALIESGLPLSLAGAAGTLAAFRGYGDQAGADGDPFILVSDVAQELGLAPHYQPWHTVRTPLAEIGNCLAVVSGALGKIAADVHVMSRTEIHEVSQRSTERVGVSSSMPQKRNPVAAVLILAAAKQVPPHVMLLQQALVAEDERTVGTWQSEWQPLREALRLVVGSAENTSAMLNGLEVHPDRMEANLRRTGPAVVAERLNIALTPLLGKLRAKKILRELLVTDGPETASAQHFRDALAQYGVESTTMDLDTLLDPRSYLGESASIVNRVRERNASMDRD